MNDWLSASTLVFEAARFGVAASLTLAGVASIVVGAIGLLRFPDFYTRLHALALVNALGAPLLLAGLAVAAWDWRIALKLLLLGALIAILAPAASHILASAAHGAGLAPHMKAAR